MGGRLGIRVPKRAGVEDHARVEQGCQIAVERHAPVRGQLRDHAAGALGPGCQQRDGVARRIRGSVMVNKTGPNGTSERSTNLTWQPLGISVEDDDPVRSFSRGVREQRVHIREERVPGAAGANDIDSDIRGERSEQAAKPEASAEGVTIRSFWPGQDHPSTGANPREQAIGLAQVRNSRQALTRVGHTTPEGSQTVYGTPATPASPNVASRSVSG